MSVVIAIQTVKGGPGKTSTSINLSAAFAQLGFETLIADVDYQGTSSRFFLDDVAALDYGMHDVFAGTPLPAGKFIQPTPYDHLSILPADDRLRPLDANHGYENGPDVLLLRQALEELNEQFDFVVIDSPPRDHKCSYSSLVAADVVVTMLVPEPFVLDGVKSFQHQIDDVRVRRNPELETRYLINSINKSATHRDIRDGWRKHFGDLVLATEIPRSDHIPTSQVYRTPITHYQPKSKPAVATVALAHELVKLFAKQTSQVHNESQHASHAA